VVLDEEGEAAADWGSSRATDEDARDEAPRRMRAEVARRGGGCSCACGPTRSRSTRCRTRTGGGSERRSDAARGLKEEEDKAEQTGDAGRGLEEEAEGIGLKEAERRGRRPRADGKRPSRREDKARPFGFLIITAKGIVGCVGRFTRREAHVVATTTLFVGLHPGARRILFAGRREYNIWSMYMCTTAMH
jgi:hypothetical protein